MRLIPTKNQFKRANVELTVSQDLKNFVAYSYDWWKFVDTDSVGNVVFCDYKYSNTTSSHQLETRSVLRYLGVEIAIKLTRCNGLNEGIKSSIEYEIAEIKNEIKNLNDLINKPRTHKSKNLERKGEIKDLEFEIADLERFLSVHLDSKKLTQKKKLAPLKKDTRSIGWKKNDRICESKRESIAYIKRLKGWAEYFKKPNGKIKVNELREFLPKIGSRDAPKSIERVCDLLGLKSFESKLVALQYRFITDIERNIPDVDSDKYQKYLKGLKRYKINTGDSVNLLDLEKLHSLMSSIENPRDTTNSSPALFPIQSEKLTELDSKKEIKYLNSAAKLRGEGRRQSHCIGSKSYINDCKIGFWALNFKGYTFFLNNDYSVNQTHGRYNCSTPHEITTELTELLNN